MVLLFQLSLRVLALALPLACSPRCTASTWRKCFRRMGCSGVKRSPPWRVPTSRVAQVCGGELTQPSPSTAPTAIHYPHHHHHPLHPHHLLLSLPSPLPRCRNRFATHNHFMILNSLLSCHCTAGMANVRVVSTSPFLAFMTYDVGYGLLRRGGQGVGGVRG